MTAREFCYWLQGFFELTSTYRSYYEFNLKSIQCIRNHLDLVEKCDSHHNNIFIDWLNMYLKNSDLDLFLKEHSVNVSYFRTDLFNVNKIQKNLASQFKHEIDPSYQCDQKELQSIHDLGKTNGTVNQISETLYRC